LSNCPIWYEAGRWLGNPTVLRRFGCGRLKRGDKGIVLRYLERTTGYSRQQMTRLVQRYESGAPMAKRYHAPDHGFERVYTELDVALLAHTDTLAAPCGTMRPDMAESSGRGGLRRKIRLSVRIFARMGS